MHTSYKQPRKIPVYPSLLRVRQSLPSIITHRKSHSSSYHGRQVLDRRGHPRAFPLLVWEWRYVGSSVCSAMSNQQLSLLQSSACFPLLAERRLDNLYRTTITRTHTHPWTAWSILHRRLQEPHGFFAAAQPLSEIPKTRYPVQHRRGS